MHSDSSDSQSEMAEQEVAEDSDVLDELFPLAPWYDPSERAFPDFADLSKCYLWSMRCARGLDELERNFQRFELEDLLPFENLALMRHSFSYVTTIVALTIAQKELLASQDDFGRIAEQLATRRLVELGEHGAHSTVCGRPYPSALDGLLDAQKRVGVHVSPLGEPILSAMASVLPHVVSSTPLLAPCYAGLAADELVSNDGLDSHSIRTLADSPEFREAVKQAYRKEIKPRISYEIQDFDGQAVLARIKAELSMLSQERKAKPTALISTNDSDAQTGPTSSKPKGGLEPYPCQLKALGGYMRAVEELGDGVKVREAYDWLKERDEDRSLPIIETWAKYLREAKRLRGLQKNTPRYGRTGRSIVRPDEL